MNEEMLRILKMVAEGKLTPEESVELLESLGPGGDPAAGAGAVADPAGVRPESEEPPGGSTVRVGVDARHVIGMICGALIAVLGAWMVLKYGESDVKLLMVIAPLALGAAVAGASVSACRPGKKDAT